MKLNLKKPLVFFDLETTGTSVATDRIVEIAMLKIMPDGSMHSRPNKGANRFLVNPGRAIPTETSMIHGIYDEDVKDAPSFAEVADQIFKFIFDCDLGGFNSNRFDIPLLAEEFLRVGIDFSIENRNLVDAQVIFHLMEQRTLKAGYKFYCDKELDGAHEALADTTATFEVFEAMIERYEGVEVPKEIPGSIRTIENDMEKIHQFCQRHKNADLMGRLVYNENDEVCINFGKHKGKTLKAVLEENPGYYGWMMQGEFPLYTKKVLSNAKKSLGLK